MGKVPNKLNQKLSDSAYSLDIFSLFPIRVHYTIHITGILNLPKALTTVYKSAITSSGEWGELNTLEIMQDRFS